MTSAAAHFQNSYRGKKPILVAKNTPNKITKLTHVTFFGQRNSFAAHKSNSNVNITIFI